MELRCWSMGRPWVEHGSSMGIPKVYSAHPPWACRTHLRQTHGSPVRWYTHVWPMDFLWVTRWCVHLTFGLRSWPIGLPLVHIADPWITHGFTFVTHSSLMSRRWVSGCYVYNRRMSHLCFAHGCLTSFSVLDPSPIMAHG